MPEFLFTPTPNEAAIEFIKSKPVVSRYVFDNLLPELQARAFTIAGIVRADVLQSVRDTIADLPRGASWDQQKKIIIAQLSPYLVDPTADAEEQAKQLAAAEAKAELLLRIHGQEAYATAAWRVMDRQRRLFPFWQYQTMGDARVRATHAALNGIVLPADSKFWNDHYPPWEWGCRCIAIPVSRSDVADMKAADKDKPSYEQRVLDGPLLRELEDNNRLVRGMNKIVNVSPEKRAGANAFHYHPGDLQLSLADLKKRYDATTWNTFETWARKTIIPDGRTVWGWLNGELPPPGIIIPRITPPAPTAPAIVKPPPAPIPGATPLQELERSIINNPRESAHLFSVDETDEIFSKGGTHNQVAFTNAEVRIMKDLILTHNHPRGSSFSSTDIRMAFSADLLEIRAIGKRSDGLQFLYSLERPDSGWSLGQLPEILAAYRRIDREVEAERWIEIRAGRITIQRAQLDHYHEVMRRLAEQFPEAIKYERTEIEG